MLKWLCTLLVRLQPFLKYKINEKIRILLFTVKYNNIFNKLPPFLSNVMKHIVSVLYYRFLIFYSIILQWTRVVWFFITSPSCRKRENYIVIAHDGFILFFADREYWYQKAKTAIQERVAIYGNKRDRAKNVIFLVGDGMGVTTLTAARIFKGQRQGKFGEDLELAWERFPALALTKVSCLFFIRANGSLVIWNRKIFHWVMKY